MRNFRVLIRNSYTIDVVGHNFQDFGGGLSLLSILKEVRAVGYNEHAIRCSMGEGERILCIIMHRGKHALRHTALHINIG